MVNVVTPITPSTPGAGDEEGVKKLAGKYDSLEHAIESLDKGFTANFHEQSERSSAIEKILERLVDGSTSIGTRGDDRNDSYARGYGRGDDREFDSTRFLAEPGRVLHEREEKFREAMEKRTAAITGVIVSNSVTVLRFQMRNPDLDEHEGLVELFMRETNPRDPLGKRLNDAAKRTRAYLKEIKSKGTEITPGLTPEGDEVIEEPTAEGAHPRPPIEKAKSADEILAEEIAEGRAVRAARFAPKKG